MGVKRRGDAAAAVDTMSVRTTTQYRLNETILNCRYHVRLHSMRRFGCGIKFRSSTWAVAFDLLHFGCKWFGIYSEWDFSFIFVLYTNSTAHCIKFMSMTHRRNILVRMFRTSGTWRVIVFPNISLVRVNNMRRCIRHCISRPIPPHERYELKWWFVCVRVRCASMRIGVQMKQTEEKPTTYNIHTIVHLNANTKCLQAVCWCAWVVAVEVEVCCIAHHELIMANIWNAMYFHLSFLFCNRYCSKGWRDWMPLLNEPEWMILFTTDTFIQTRLGRMRKKKRVYNSIVCHLITFNLFCGAQKLSRKEKNAYEIVK